MAKINRFYNPTPQKYVSTYVPLPLEFIKGKTDRLQKQHDTVKKALQDKYEGAFLDKEAAPYFDTKVLKMKEQEYEQKMNDVFDNFLGGSEGKRKALELVKSIKKDPVLKMIDKGYENYTELTERIAELNKKGKYNEANALDANLKFNAYVKNNNNFFANYVSKDDTAIMENMDVYKSIEKYVNNLKENGHTGKVGVDPFTGDWTVTDYKGVSANRVKGVLQEATDAILNSPEGTQIINEAKYKAYRNGELEEFYKDEKVRKKYINNTLGGYFNAAILEHSNKQTKQRFWKRNKDESRNNRFKGNPNMIVSQPVTYMAKTVGDDIEEIHRKAADGDKAAIRTETHLLTKVGQTYKLDNATLTAIKNIQSTLRNSINSVRAKQGIESSGYGVYSEGISINEYLELFPEGKAKEEVEAYIKAQYRGKDYNSPWITDELLERFADPSNIIAYKTGKKSSEVEEDINKLILSGEGVQGTQTILTDKVDKFKQAMIGGDPGQFLDMSARDEDINEADYIQKFIQDMDKAKAVAYQSYSNFDALKLTFKDGSTALYKVNPDAKINNAWSPQEYTIAVANNIAPEEARQYLNEQSTQQLLPPITKGDNSLTARTTANLAYTLTHSEGENPYVIDRVSNVLSTPVQKAIEYGSIYRINLVADEENVNHLEINDTPVTIGKLFLSIVENAEQQVESYYSQSQQDTKEKLSGDSKQNLVIQTAIELLNAIMPGKYTIKDGEIILNSPENEVFTFSTLDPYAPSLGTLINFTAPYYAKIK